MKRDCCELMLRETGGWACTTDRSVGASTKVWSALFDNR